MANLGKSPFDDASGLSADLNSRGSGKINEHLTGNLVVDGTITSSGGGEVIPNAAFFETENFAGTGVLPIIGTDVSDNTVVNAATGKLIELAFNKVNKGNISATALTYPAFNLSDGSDKNYNVEVYAAGTAYSLTNTAAALDFGTTDPSLVLNKAGTYLIFGRVNLKYNAATFAAVRTATLKLRRTNNTAADLTNGTMTAATQIITTLTYTMGVFSLPPVIYTTAVLTDAITIFGNLDVVPTAGSLDAVEASIVAVRLF